MPDEIRYLNTLNKFSAVSSKQFQRPLMQIPSYNKKNQTKTKKTQKQNIKPAQTQQALLSSQQPRENYTATEECELLLRAFLNTRGRKKKNHGAR